MAGTLMSGKNYIVQSTSQIQTMHSELCLIESEHAGACQAVRGEQVHVDPAEAAAAAAAAERKSIRCQQFL